MANYLNLRSWLEFGSSFLCFSHLEYHVIVRLSAMGKIIVHIFLHYELVLCDWAFFRGYCLSLLSVVSRANQWLQQNVFGLEHRKARHQREQRTDNLARWI